MKCVVAASLFGFGLWLGALSGASANDSMAMFGAGGLQFQNTDELQMTSEELYLSAEEVRVTYNFRNLTNHDASGTLSPSRCRRFPSKAHIKA